MSNDINDPHVKSAIDKLKREKRLREYTNIVLEYADFHGLTYSQALSVLNDPSPEARRWVDWDDLISTLIHEQFKRRGK